MINYVKQLSLEETRRNSSYTFKQIKIPVETVSNNGVVYVGSTQYTNKCFFIALQQGLEVYGYKLSPFQLMRLAGFMNRNELVDTDNLFHHRMLQHLLEGLPEVSLSVHYGEYNKSDRRWYTTPDVAVQYGPKNGNDLVRILNKGNHFECITTEEEQFVYHPRSMTASRVQQLQKEAWNHH